VASFFPTTLQLATFPRSYSLTFFFLFFAADGAALPAGHGFEIRHDGMGRSSLPFRYAHWKRLAVTRTLRISFVPSLIGCGVSLFGACRRLMQQV